VNEPWDDPIDDEMFDVAAVEAGAWASPYGPDDQLGTYREVTPAKTARALGLLDLTKPVHTFHMGETLFNGYPAFARRPYEQRLLISGFDPGGDFGGIVARPVPRGPNRMTHLEERVQSTYNIGSKVNALLHSGVGTTFYGPRSGEALAADHGVRELDTPTWGPPLCTRGLLLDVLGLKVSSGDDSALELTAGGEPVLHGTYRVTVEDCEAAIERQALPAFEPGDAVFLHTGWNRLLGEAERYLSGCPGPYLRELRWLARNRPALLGVDAWMLSTYSAEVMGPNITPGHQLVFMRYGIRTAEGFKLAELVAAGVDRFVFCHSPLRAVGATATNAPAMALANLSAGG